MSTQLAVQLFTLREHTTTAADLAASLAKISAMGYPAVQLSAVGAMNGDDPEVDVATAARMLADHGLRCIATHRPWQRLRENLSEEIDFHHALGCDFVAIGGISPREYSQDYSGYRQWLSDAREVMSGLSAAGLRFGHHNHSREFFRPERHGKTLHDILVEEGPQELCFELDLYWLEHAGLNCCRVLERVPGRCPVIHLKDKEALVESNDTRMAPIGEGNMDWQHIIPACRAAGVEWYAIEQDQCFRDPFDCLRSSFDYLRGLGV